MSLIAGHAFMVTNKVRGFLHGDAMTIGKEGSPSQITISWAIALSAFPVFLGLVGLISWALTNAINANNTSAKVAELRIDMVDGFKALREQVAGLPMQAATLKQVDERGRELIVNLNNVAQSLASTDRTAYEAGQSVKRLEQQINQRLDRAEHRLDLVEDRINKPVPLRDTR